MRGARFAAEVRVVFVAAFFPVFAEARFVATSVFFNADVFFATFGAAFDAAFDAFFLAERAPAVAASSRIHVGAWSLAPGRARTQRSTPA